MSWMYISLLSLNSVLETSQWLGHFMWYGLFMLECKIFWRNIEDARKLWCCFQLLDQPRGWRASVGKVFQYLFENTIVVVYSTDTDTQPWWSFSLQLLFEKRWIWAFLWKPAVRVYTHYLCKYEAHTQRVKVVFIGVAPLSFRASRWYFSVKFCIKYCLIITLSMLRSVCSFLFLLLLG
jgi:hypothetical protein